MFNDYSFGIKTTATFGDKGKQVDKTHASLIGTTHNVCHTHTFVLCVIFIRERPHTHLLSLLYLSQMPIMQGLIS